MIKLCAGFIDNLAKIKGNLLKMWTQALILLLRKRSEKPVFNRVIMLYQSRQE